MLRARFCCQLALLAVCLVFATGMFAQSLTWSSYVGASSVDTFTAAAIDSSNNLYLAGHSGQALLVEKLSADGTTVMYHTIFTSTPVYNVTVEDIRVDSNNVAYIAGSAGPNFPTTANAFQQSVTSGTHALVAVVSADGSTLTYATYLAGTTSAGDQANGVALDSTGKIYVTGSTSSTTFPTTTGVFQTKNNSGQNIAFVSKLDSTQSGAASLVYSTYLSGPTGTSSENGIAVDGSGNAYVSGNATSDFPVTPGAFAYDGEGLGQGGVYVTKLNSTATALGLLRLRGRWPSQWNCRRRIWGCLSGGARYDRRFSDDHRGVPGAVPCRLRQRV